jgi:hypothetical protein
MKKSERQCIVDEDISECDCERLRSDFAALIEVRIRSVMGLLMTIIVLAFKKRLRPSLRVFFGYVDLKKKRVGYTFVMNFEGQSGSRSEKICDLFAKLMERTYANEP